MLEFLSEHKRKLILSYPFMRYFLEGTISKETFLDNLTAFSAELIEKGFTEEEFVKLSHIGAEEADETVAQSGEDVLRRRIEREAGILIFGKMPGDSMDFHLMAQKRLTPLAFRTNKDVIPMDPFIGVGGLLDEEMLRYSNDNLVYDKIDGAFVKKPARLKELVIDGQDVPASYIHYSVYVSATDAYKRRFPVVWSIIGSQELCAAILGFFRKNPERAFEFFNGLFEEFKYKAKRRGVLFLIDGDKIPLDQKKNRQLHGLEAKDYELVNYKVA
jgi:hypothetical protein